MVEQALPRTWWDGVDRPTVRTALRAALAIVAFAAAYVMLQRLTFLLRFSPLQRSPIWMPGGLLLGVLIVTPPATWWRYLVGGFVGLIGSHFDDPAVSFLPGLLFVYPVVWLTAAGGAWAIRRVEGGPPYFRSPTSLLLMLLAAGVAVPAALAGPTVLVRAIEGRPNLTSIFVSTFMLAAVGVPVATPMVTFALTGLGPALRSRPVRRVVELAALLGCLCVVTLWSFGRPAGAAASPAALYAPLPLLVWAAVRFELAGTCLGIAVMAIVASRQAIAGQGPFATESPAANVFQLQAFIVAAAAPLMYLAVVVRQQRQTSQALRASEAETARQQAQLATIYRTAPVGLAFIDTDLRYVSINDDLARQNGPPPEAHVGRKLREILPADMIDGVEAAYRQVLSTGTALSDVEVHAPTLDRHWVVDYHPVRDSVGDVLGVNTVVQEVTQQRRAEAVLRRSQQLNVAILASLREHVAVLDRHGMIVTVNEAWTRFSQAGTPGVGIGVNYLDVCRRASGGRSDGVSVAKALAGIEAVLDGTEHWFEMEYLCPTPERDRWFLMSVTPLRDPGGGAVVSHRDVTELKHAEQAVRRSEASLRASNHRAQELAGRLINAQEAERARIARELHDDVDQQLAAISLSLSALRRVAPADKRLQDELAAIQRQAIDAAEDVRLLSHQLHPGVLRHAGLPAALKSYCAEFRTRHGIAAALHIGGGVEEMMRAAGDEVALCLYRTAQEALNNVARHSGARRATVTLRVAEYAAAVELVVEDDGRGFDVAAAREAGGLGLLSLDERARLVRGTSAIESRPDRGTAVRLIIPVEGAHDGSRKGVAG